MFDDKWERRRLRWEQRRERRNRPWRSSERHLFSGIVFVVVGALFLLGNIGLINVGAVIRFWPVILIALGAFRILESRDEFGQSHGIFWVVVGGFLLLGTLGILRVAFYNFWPVLLITIGALMLWRSSIMKRERSESAADPTSATDPTSEVKTDFAPDTEYTRTSSTSHFTATAILSGFQRRINSQDFRGGEATAILGGCEIDLRSASITPPHEPVIRVFALFGGLQIRVPDDWTVVSEVEAILGGFDDKKTWPPKIESKRVIIRGQVIFGGIEVRN